MLAGLEKPSKRRNYYQQYSLWKKWNEEQLVNSEGKMLVIFQSFNLISSMNALENVALPWLSWVSKSNRLSSAERITDLVNLVKHANQYRDPAATGGHVARTLLQ